MYWNKSILKYSSIGLRLTLTWDVLKCIFSTVSVLSKKWLTLTWDVLKLPSKMDVQMTDRRLTLTWDVLKFLYISMKSNLDMININMRCIEIHRWDFLRSRLNWLTLTWDVLKLSKARLIIYAVQININMRCIEMV